MTKKPLCDAKYTHLVIGVGPIGLQTVLTKRNIVLRLFLTLGIHVGNSTRRWILLRRKIALGFSDVWYRFFRSAVTLDLTFFPIYIIKHFKRWEKNLKFKHNLSPASSHKYWGKWSYFIFSCEVSCPRLRWWRWSRACARPRGSARYVESVSPSSQSVKMIWSGRGQGESRGNIQNTRHQSWRSTERGWVCWGSFPIIINNNLAGLWEWQRVGWLLAVRLR